MADVFPSQIVEYIDSSFPASSFRGEMFTVVDDVNERPEGARGAPSQPLIW